MMLEWNEKSVEFYMRAALREPYVEDIISAIFPYIEDRDVIDAGCGIGNITFEMGKYAKSVLGIDCQSYGIEFAKNFYEKSKNVEFETKDFSKMQKNSCETLTAISVGSVADVFDILFDAPTKYLILIKGQKSQHFPKKPHSNEILKILDDRKIPLKKMLISTSFGQMFKSEEEAFEFSEIYNLSENISEYLKANLKETEGAFPYYLENKKILEVFVIDKER